MLACLLSGPGPCLLGLGSLPPPPLPCMWFLNSGGVNHCSSTVSRVLSLESESFTPCWKGIDLALIYRATDWSETCLPAEMWDKNCHTQQSASAEQEFPRGQAGPGCCCCCCCSHDLKVLICSDLFGSYSHDLCSAPYSMNNISSKIVLHLFVYLSYLLIYLFGCLMQTKWSQEGLLRVRERTGTWLTNYVECEEMIYAKAMEWLWISKHFFLVNNSWNNMELLFTIHGMIQCMPIDDLKQISALWRTTHCKGFLAGLCSRETCFTFYNAGSYIVKIQNWRLPWLLRQRMLY